MLKRGRTSGNVILNNLDLTEIPSEVIKFNELVFPDQKWFECVTMKKLDLSHN
jgi:hypothetical protein